VAELVVTVALFVSVIWTALHLYLWWRMRHHPLGGENLRGYYSLLRKKLLFLLPIAMLLCASGVIGGVNIYFRWTGIYNAPDPLSSAYYPLVEEVFAGSDGKFDYPEFEAFMLEQFELLDKDAQPPEAPNPRLHRVPFLTCVQFIASRPTQEIGNLIPALKRHKSNREISMRWGWQSGIWPFELILADAEATLGHLCRHVLNVHGVQ
jgi:hypothetical protein